MGLRDWRGSALPGQPPDLDLIFVIPRALISGGGALALLAVRTPSEGDRACPGELDLLVKKTVALESASHPPTSLERIREADALGALRPVAPAGACEPAPCRVGRWAADTALRRAPGQR
jgi:hypothetical protein